MYTYRLDGRSQLRPLCAAGSGLPSRRSLHISTRLGLQLTKPSFSERYYSAVITCDSVRGVHLQPLASDCSNSREQRVKIRGEREERVSTAVLYVRFAHHGCRRGPAHALRGNPCGLLLMVWNSGGRRAMEALEPQGHATLEARSQPSLSSRRRGVQPAGCTALALLPCTWPLLITRRSGASNAAQGTGRCRR